MFYVILTIVFLILLSLTIWSLGQEIKQEREINDNLQKEIDRLRKFLP